MGKSKSSSKTSKVEEKSKPAGLPFGGASLDPTLSSLFAQSVRIYLEQDFEI
jgi:nucleolar protein 12